MQVTSLTQRRQHCARGILSISQNSGPLGPTDQRRLNDYIREMDEINLALRHDYAGRYAREFDQWIRSGESAQTPEHRQVVTEYRATVGVEGTPTGGAYPTSGSGYFVPVGFVNQVQESMKWASPFFEPGFCDLRDTLTGAPLPFPTDSDTGISGEQLAEGAQVSTADVTIGNTVLGSYRFSSKLVFVTIEQLQDSSINLTEYLSHKFGVRLARALATPLTTGAGGGNGPTGCLYGITPALTASGSSDTDGTSAGANTLGLGDLVALEKALDPCYRPKAKFMMHPSTMATLKTVKDTTKRPVFESLINSGTLLGYPVALNTAMDVLQTSASSPAVNRTPVALGDFGYFKVRRATPILYRKVEQYITQGVVAFFMIWRVDSSPISVANAIQTIQTTF